MFIPYRASIKHTRFPVVTLVVVIVCLLVYWAQDRNIVRIERSAKDFCANEEVSAPLVRGLKASNSFIMQSCDDLLAHIYLGSKREEHLAWHKRHMATAGDDEAAEALERHYRAFAAQAPAFMTERLVKYSGDWNPLRLLTSVISHASWDHVIGNLFFFFAFGVVVETIIGPVLFLLMFFAMAFGTGALQNMLTLTQEGRAGLGLSGVVMSVMTLAAYLAPHVKIRFFFFYFLFFGVVSWPLWSVAGWYVFWNLWDNHFWGRVSNIGYVAHLCGAAFGLILGLTVFRNKRHWVQQHLVLKEPTVNDEESWLYKFNAYGATPVVAYFIFFYGFAALIFGLYLLITFMQNFAGQLLIAAPIVAGLYKIYQMKKPKTLDRTLQEKGLQHMVRHEFQQAEKILLPLAEAGHARSQHAMGMLYSTPGAKRNDHEALKWFNAAAQRGFADANYQLGLRYYHGMGMAKDLPKAITHLESAARKGLPDAASTLAHLYENGPKGTADNDKAIEWLYKAGVGYHQAGRKDDAQSTIEQLKSRAARYPAVFQMITELEKLVTGNSASQANRNPADS